VKTSIIFIDKEIAAKNQFDRIMFIDIQSDGYSLGAQRRPSGHNDLGNALVLIKEAYKEIKEGNVDHSAQHYFPFQDPEYTISVAPLQYKFELVRRARILESPAYSLNGGGYSDTVAGTGQKYPMVPIGNLATINPSKSETNSLDPNINVSFVPMADLNETGATFTASRSRKLSDVKSGYTYFRSDDVILAKVTPCFENGKAGIARDLLNGIGFGSSEYYVLRTSDEVIPEYIFYSLKDGAFRKAAKASMTGTGGLQRIPKAFLESYVIPLPPLDVQKKIIDEINNKQNAIDNAREIIATLERERAYFDPSTRAAREDWPVVSFKEVATLEYGKALPARSRNEGKYPVMGSNGISGLHDHALIEGPGIVVGRKGSAGFVQWIDEDYWPIDTTYYIKPNTELNLRYLYYVLCNSGMEKLRNGAGIPGLNREDVYSSIKIPLPPAEIQEQIVAEFAEEQQITDANRKLINIYEQKIAQVLAEI
jgi:type I restriction enzyme M protein